MTEPAYIANPVAETSTPEHNDAITTVMALRAEKSWFDEPTFHVPAT